MLFPIRVKLESLTIIAFLLILHLTGSLAIGKGVIDAAFLNSLQFRVSDTNEFCLGYNLLPQESKAIQLLIAVQNLPARGLGSVSMIIKGPFGYFREFMLNSIPNDLSTATKQRTEQTTKGIELD